MLSILHKFFPLLVFLLLTACYPSYKHLEYHFEEQGHYIKDVPFFPQEEHYCGPASLASVLGYWGHNVSQEEVAREVYTPKIGGTITVDMANYARGKGFNARYYNGDMGSLRKELDKGHPLILFLHIGNSIVPRRHYIVAVGYDESRKVVIANSGREKDTLIPYQELLKAWKRTGYWTLLILPKEDTGQ